MKIQWELHRTTIHELGEYIKYHERHFKKANNENIIRNILRTNGIAMKNLENKNGKIDNCMDILSNKLKTWDDLKGGNLNRETECSFSPKSLLLKVIL